MTKYIHICRGDSFRVMSADEVKTVKTLAGKIPQNGIRRLNDQVYLLQSHSLHDIVDSFRNGGWAHSTSARIREGMTVYIVPAKTLIQEYGQGAIGCSFVATEDMHKEDTDEFVWTSDV